MLKAYGAERTEIFRAIGGLFGGGLSKPKGGTHEGEMSDFDTSGIDAGAKRHAEGLKRRGRQWHVKPKQL